jgi:hypothetical protein
MKNCSNNTGLSTVVFAMLCLLCLFPPGAAQAVSVGQVDTFEDGTLQGWSQGLSASTADHMRNVSSGGPAGLNDNYLEVTSDSTLPFSGNRLTFFNREQWTGDYTAAGITAIAMDVRNFCPCDPLNLRLGVNASVIDSTGTSFLGGTFVTSAITLDSSSGWTRVVFSLRPEDLIAVDPARGNYVMGNDVQITLANVNELRLLNSADPDWNGLPITSRLGVDNIHVVPLPPALVMFASGLVVLLTRGRKNNLQT